MTFEISTVVVICAAVFCAAMLLTSALNRPVVVVQPPRNESGGGCLIVIALLVGALAIWLLFTFRSVPDNARPAPDEKKQVNSFGETGTPERIGSHINTSPVHQSSSYLPRLIELLKTEINADADCEAHWVLRIKIFDSYAKSRGFKSPMPDAKLRVCETESGEFWRYVLVQSEADGCKKMDQWAPYRDMGLDLKVVEIVICSK